MVNDDLCLFWQSVGLHASADDVCCLSGTRECRIETVGLRKVRLERVQRPVGLARAGDE